MIEVRVPGDKSLTHRALILASLAEGESRLRGLLPGADPQATWGALRAMGVSEAALPGDGSELRVAGRGLRGLRQPGGVLDCANSGTTARLLLGVLAGQCLTATLTGDESLRRRPMRRVTEPLARMGGRFRELGTPGCLPIEVQGADLRPLEQVSPVASAQVKGAILLAGLVGGVPVTVTEPSRSRDHTERLLAGLGVRVRWGPAGEAWEVRLEGAPASLAPLDFAVPGDFSSASFLLVLGLLLGGRQAVRIRNVGLNPTRTGLLEVLARMGARVEVDPAHEARAGEPVGSLVAHRSELRAIEVTGSDVPGLIDEVPILAVAAARAAGQTRITGAAELRVKESDRIAGLVANLRAVGIRAEELPDGLEIEGSDRPLKGEVRSFGDHRIAMAFGVLGALPGNRIGIAEPEVVDVSFPGFWELLARVASHLEAAAPAIPGGRSNGGPPDDGGRGKAPPAEAAGGAGEARARGRGRGSIVTIDGPAGSGKSTTARAVAERLGFRHLDSGALYRALTFALLEAGIAPDRWADLTAAELDRFDIRLEPREAGYAVLLNSRVLDTELRSPRVTAHVSQLSRLPAVRRWLLARQRDAGAEGFLVADGRDMGSVVFPDADVKFFLTASLEERARRRLRERGVMDAAAAELAEEMQGLEARDERDRRRGVSPLRVPDNAIVVDTTDLSLEAQVEAIVRRVQDLTRW